MAFCFVRTCPNQGPKTEDKRIKFYHFPKDVWMAQQWIEAANNPKYKEEYSRHYRICSVHFEQRYKRSHPHEVAYGLPTPKTFRGISADAVPTLFLPEKLCPNIDPFKDIEDTTVKIERVESEDEVLGTKEEMARLMMELENQKKENEKLMGLYLNQIKISKGEGISMPSTSSNEALTESIAPRPVLRVVEPIEVTPEQDEIRLNEPTQAIQLSETGQSTEPIIKIEVEEAIVTYSLVDLYYDLEALSTDEKPKNWTYNWIDTGLLLAYFGDSFRHFSRSLLICRDMTMEVRAEGKICESLVLNRITSTEELKKTLDMISNLSICLGVRNDSTCPYGLVMSVNENSRCMSCSLNIKREA